MIILIIKTADLQPDDLSRSETSQKATAISTMASTAP
jgi:hypothetical protein